MDFPIAPDCCKKTFTFSSRKMKVFTLLCAFFISAYATETSDQSLDSTSGEERLISLGLNQFSPSFSTPKCQSCNGCKVSGCSWGCRNCNWSGSCPDSCRWNCKQRKWECSENAGIDKGPEEPTIVDPKPEEPTIFDPKPENDFTLYASPDYQGDTLNAQLNNVGDCVEFWNPEKTLPPNMTSFDNRGQSIRLSAGVCVRLFEHDCTWHKKGKTLDVFPDSQWASNFDSVGMDGVSAVKRIECTLSFPPLVTVYREKNYSGKSVDLTGLRTIGDCQEFWSPNGYNTIISNELRDFNDQTASIQLKDASTCLRLYEKDCKQTEGRILDLTAANSKVATDLSTHSWNGIVSAIEIIPCPLMSSIVLYSKPNFEGDSLTLTGLFKAGDCVEFWSPEGYKTQISDDLRQFNDRTTSIRFPIERTCLRLYERDCKQTEGRILDLTAANSKVATDLSTHSWNGIVSAIEIIQCPMISSIVVYSKPNFEGDSLTLTGLSKPGDCVEFWSSEGYKKRISDDLRQFNDRATSIRFPIERTCLRLYEADCKQKEGRFLDLTAANSKVFTDLSTHSWNGIVSAIEIIPCPLDSGIVVYSKPNFEGDSLTLTGLSKPGDCVEFWSPEGYKTPISDDMRQLNDRTTSIKLPFDSTCLRLYERDCKQPEGRILDLTAANSEVLTDLSTHSWNGIISAIEIIPCPLDSGIVVYSKPHFEGDSLTLTGLSKPGDCVDFWSPDGYKKRISDDLRRFNDRTMSIKLSPGTCVTLFDNNCGEGRSTGVLSSGSPASLDTSKGNLGGAVSSVMLTQCVQ